MVFVLPIDIDRGNGANRKLCWRYCTCPR